MSFGDAVKVTLKILEYLKRSDIFYTNLSIILIKLFMSINVWSYRLMCSLPTEYIM